MTLIFVLAILIGSIYLLYNFLSDQKAEKLNREVEADLKQFKNSADSILIDLDSAEIKSHSWTEEKVTDNSRFGGYDQLVGRGDLNTESVLQQQNVIHLRPEYRGDILDIYARVDMDPTTLKLKLTMQKETHLYIHPMNPEMYYLDLEFLNS